MINPFPKFTRLYEALWPEGIPASEKLYAVLDGAKDSRIFAAVDASHQDKYCLYSSDRRWPGSDISWNLIGVAPYLVELEMGDELTHFVLRHGWCENWGVFLRSEAGILALRRHFRELLIVRAESGRKLMFRFYDPRVLRLYLPTCTPSELRTFFGPVGAWILPARDPRSAIQYRFDNSHLLQEEPIQREAVAAG